MADAINRQVKVDVLIDTTNALRSVKGIQQALDKLSIKRIPEKEGGDPFKPYTQGAGKARDELGKLQQELNKAKRQLQNDLIKNNMSFTFLDSKEYKEQVSRIQGLTGQMRTLKQVMDSLDEQKKLKTTAVSGDTVANERAINKFNVEEQKRAAEEQKRIAAERKQQLLEERNQVAALAKAEKERAAEAKRAAKEQEKQLADLAKAQAKLVRDSSGKELSHVNNAGFKGYATELAKVEKYAASLNYELQRTMKGTAAYYKLKEELEKVRKEYAALNRESVNFRKNIGISGSRGFYDINHTLDYFRAKVRSRLVYSFATEAEGVLMNIVPSFVNALDQYQQNRVNFAQVMPNDFANDQEAMNDAMREFIQVAADYGASVQDVIEAGRLWGRIYKDVNVIQELVRASTKLSITDDMSLVEVNKGLEATMQQYAVHLKDANEAQQVSGKIIDTWAKLADNAGVTAANLAAASERAGGAAYQAGVGFDSLQAMIATMSQVTGKAGGEIGRSIRSMLVSMNTDRARKEIQNLGVAIYELGENGEMRLRSMEKVIPEVMQALAKSNKDISKSVLTFSGGKYQYNNVMALLRSYDLYMKNLETAQNSAGWADEQVAIQYETISRQTKALTADLQQLVSALDEAGAGTAITDFIKILREIVQVLQYIDPENINNIATSLKAFAAFKIGMGTISGLTSMGALIKDLYTNIRLLPQAIKESSNAFTTFGGTLRMIGSLGNVLALLTMLWQVGTMIYDAYMSDANAMRELKQEIDGTDLNISGIANDIDKLKEGSSVISDLSKSIQTNTEIVQSSVTTDEEKVKANDKLSESTKTLTSMIGNAGLERIKAAGYTEEAINKEINAYNQLKIASNDEMQLRIYNEKQKTLELRKQVEERINEYMKEIRLLQGRSDTRLFDAKARYEQYKDDPILGAEVKWELERAQKMAVETTKRTNEIILQLRQARIEQDKTIEQERYLTALSNGEKYTPKGYGDIEGGKGGVVDNEAPAKNNANQSANAKDFTQQAIRNQYQQQRNKLWQEGKTAATEYENALKAIENIESQYMATVDTISAKGDIYTQRKEELTQYQAKLQAFQDKLIKDLDNEMASNQELANIVEYKANATATEKLRTIEVNRELFQSLKSYSNIVNMIEQVNSKIEETKGKILDVNKNIEATPEAIRQQTLKDNQMEANIALARVNRPTDPFTENKQVQIQLEQAYADLEVYRQALDAIALERQQKLDTMTAAEISAIDAKYQAELLNIEQTNQRIAELEYQKNLNIRQGLADITNEFLIQGNSLRDIWNSLWTDLAREAIQRLFQVKAQASLLGSLFGLFGGGGNDVIGTGVTSNPVLSIGGSIVKTHTGGNILSYPKMHSGGMVDQGRKGVIPQLRNDEVVRTLQVGEEVNSLADRRSNEILGAVAMKALDAENMRPNNVYITALDSRTFAEYLNDNADVLMGVLAKQGALGRRS